MAQFNNRYQTADDFCFSYQHKDWAKSERWFFGDTKSDKDNRRIQQKQAELEAEGYDEKTAATFAALTVMHRRWTVRLPASFVEPVLGEDGEETYDDAGNVKTRPHPLAGKVVPFSIDAMIDLGEPVYIDAYVKLFEHYVGQFGTKEDTKSLEASGSTDR